MFRLFAFISVLVLSSVLSADGQNTANCNVSSLVADMKRQLDELQGKMLLLTKCTQELSMNSAILADNRCYQSFLQEFLTPAVGSDHQWLLCYRASLHGWALSSFHSRCDGKPNTVTLIRNGPYVFGGYTDIPWESSGAYGYTPKAFIFSLNNNEGLTPFKSMVKKAHEAIYRGASYGPTFGPGWDIYISNNANSNFNSHTDFGDQDAYTIPSGVTDRYTVLAGTRYFSPDEVEVFYLT